MRATFLAGGPGIAKGRVDGIRTIDIAPTIAYILGVPEPQQSQGEVRLDVLKGGRSRTLVPLIGLNDFHGQLEPTTTPMDGLNVSVGGARAARHDVRRGGAPSCPAGALLLAAGDNVGASPANSGLLEDMPAIDVENAWGLDATSYGNHEFDYGVARLQAASGTRRLPVPGRQHRRHGDRWRTRTGWRARDVFQYGGIRIGVIGIGLETTPELVSAGRHRGPHVPARGRDDPDGIREAAASGRQGAGRADPRGHRRRDEHDRRRSPACRGKARSSPSPKASRTPRSTSIIAGHTHRVSNLMVGDILVAEGHQRRGELLGASRWS